MNKGFYTKLAWTGIAKNKQLYYPYLIAGVAMVMVFYVFNFLGASEIVHSLPGKEVLPLLFDYGSWAIGLFSIPFLFYTNSSLIKKRKKELEGQLRTEQDETRRQSLESELAQVERELSQKDNDAYRRQHTVFTKM